MKRTSIQLIILFVFCFVQMHGQVVDTIFTYKEKIGCQVKEVSPDMVKYAFPNEEVLNVLPISRIRKIQFKSGRIQSFSTAPIVKPVRFVVDWNNVFVTKNELDVYGLKKFPEISAVAWYGNLQSTRNKALDHLKMLAAMKGYKVVLKTFEEDGFRENISEAQISGIPFTDSIPSLNDFKERTGIKTKFKAQKKYLLSNSGLYEEEAYGHFNIQNVSEKDGVVYFVGYLGLHEGTFRLIYLGPTYFVVDFAGETHTINFLVGY